MNDTKIQQLKVSQDIVEMSQERELVRCNLKNKERKTKDNFITPTKCFLGVSVFAPASIISAFKQAIISKSSTSSTIFSSSKCILL